MKKVAILGANGMAGHMVSLYLNSLGKYEVTNLCHGKKLNRNSFIVDVSNLSDLEAVLKQINPDIIINCIGILNDKSDDNIAYTSYINTFFPHFLENYYINSPTKIIHISTDCVFSGKRGSYSEEDYKDEKSIYGLTKNFGEIINTKDLTIRTSIIGPELKDGKGLFNWFMKQDGEVLGYKNAYWTGVTTLELAKIIDTAIEKEITGLYNVVPNERISKYDLLNLIKNIFNKDSVKVLEYENELVDKSLISVKDFDYTVKSYEEMLKELKVWMDNHKIYYRNYYSLKDKVIIIWSKIKANDFKSDEEAEKWIKHRIKVFINYTAKSFKNQTNQNFYYFINYDEKARDYIFKELENYPSLPSNIIFTDRYHEKIKEIIPNYKTLYFVRIDSDDMYEKNFIQKLTDYKNKEDTQALICQSGYIYDTSNNMLAKWFYKSPPFFTLVYHTADFFGGIRHDVHGHSSVINLSHEIIEGDNFVVIVHGENTVTKFNSSFRKELIDEPCEKEKILNHFELETLD